MVGGVESCVMENTDDVMFSTAGESGLSVNLEDYS